MSSAPTIIHRFKQPPRTLSLSVFWVLVCASMLIFAAEPVPAIAQRQDPFNDWLDNVVFDVNTYWQGMLNSVGYVYVPADWVAFNRPISTGCGRATSSSGPFYCRKDGTVYLETDFIKSQYRNVGDFAAAIVVAHEIGHHIQVQVGITSSISRTILLELNADCLAGMWAGYVGYQDRLDPGDLRASVFGTAMAGDPAGTAWTAPGAHGTPSERAEWLLRGYSANDISGCNTW
jgi:predicted metalloprotease